MEGGQTPTHFLQSILSAPVPLPHLPPPPHTLSQIEFWPKCCASGREVSKNLILVGTIITLLHFNVTLWSINILLMILSSVNPLIHLSQTRLY